ncbi:MAG: hypothetical protein AAF607_08195 [Pseudomonadota bacterium]
MKSASSFVVMILAISFTLGIFAGHVMADTQDLEVTPRPSDELAIPAEPIPADPEADVPLIYNLVEPMESVADEIIIYAV